MASLMSTNNNSDIAPLDDFDEDDDGQYIVRPIKKLNKKINVKFFKSISKHYKLHMLLSEHLY